MWHLPVPISQAVDAVALPTYPLSFLERAVLWWHLDFNTVQQFFYVWPSSPCIISYASSGTQGSANSCKNSGLR